MLNPFIAIALIAFIVLIMLALCEVIYRITNTAAEYTRKSAHLLSGVICLSFPYIFNTYWPVFVLAVLFVTLLWSTKKLGYLQAIHNVKRKTQGSYLYPFSIFLCFSIYLLRGDKLYYFIPVIVLAVSDPLAALTGRLLPVGKYTFWGETKTLAGSLAFLLSAIIACSFCYYYFNGAVMIKWYAILIISVVSTIAEAIGRRGEDNLWIPLAAMASIYLTENL